MIVKNLNVESIKNIENILSKRYSVIVGVNQNRYLMNPSLRFDGFNLFIRDDLNPDMKIPGEYKVSITDSSVFFHSLDKSDYFIGMGFRNLDNELKETFERNYMKLRFAYEVNSLDVPESSYDFVSGYVRDFIRALSHLTVDTTNEIKIRDMKFKLLVDYRDPYSNHYGLFEDDLELILSSESLAQIVYDLQRELESCYTQ